MEARKSDGLEALAQGVLSDIRDHVAGAEQYDDMNPPGPTLTSSRLEELWRRLASVLDSDEPLPTRIAAAASVATGGRETTLYVRERDAWSRTRGKSCGPAEPGEIPDPLPEHPVVRDANLWVPLATEGEVHGLLRLRDMSSTGKTIVSWITRVMNQPVPTATR